MVAITDEGVTVFAVPSFAVKGQAFRTKGAAALCWHHEWQLLAVAKPGGIGKPNQYDFISLSMPLHSACGYTIKTLPVNQQRYMIHNYSLSSAERSRCDVVLPKYVTVCVYIEHHVCVHRAP